MNVFVTGATGFVGSSVAKALLKRGDDVGAMARPESDRGRLGTTAVSWTTADLTQPNTLAGVFQGVDAVVHAAGRLGQFGVPDEVYFRLHVEGTRALCEELLGMTAPPRLLHISSPGVLGPISGPPATENAPLAPSNIYERSKAAAEKVVRIYAKQGLPVIIARPEFMYGPGDRHVLGLFQAVQNGRFFYIGDGHNTCHPTYLDDAVEGILRVLDAGRQGEIYHIAGPRPVTFRELAGTIAAALGVPAPRLALPRPLALSGAAVLEGLGRFTGFTPPLSRDGVAFFSESRCFSWTKAQQELGYEPQVNLSNGVARTVAWYRQQGYL